MKDKLSSHHLEKRAYVYVRQSTQAQVHGHIESGERQYRLVERAAALGWAPEEIEVIDEDQGHSGATAEGRSGFARVARDVADGKVGAVLALEMSRLARSSQDWQRLLSLCAVTGVLVIDETSIYDPSRHDDKLLLDLKGAMSEQEIHWLSLRLAGGRLNKARRGACYVVPPAGYVWGGRGLELDPDEAVQRAIHVLFERFRVEPSARAVVRWARASGFLVPSRDRSKGEVVWRPLVKARLTEMLHNPFYAGVYVYGRRPQKKVVVDGEIRRARHRIDEPSKWPVRLEDAHPGYITWETYLANVAKLRNNRTCGGGPTAPREGPALLSGLLICGRCGRRMRPHYEPRKSDARRWRYSCSGASEAGAVLCWSVSGRALDRAVEQSFIDTVAPSEVDFSLAVERESAGQAESLARAWRARIEQVGYEVRLAERRYKAVDPDNRVVARTLEGQWEQRLRELAEVEQQYAEARRQRQVELTPEERARIRQLANDLPSVWHSKTTSVADRKAMLRIAIEAITLQPVEVPKRTTLLRIQWRGGEVMEINVARPGLSDNKTDPVVLERLRELAAAALHDDEIAQQLNRAGFRSGSGRPWNERSVRWARRRFGIARTAPERTRMAPLPDQDAEGRYSVPGAVRHFGVSRKTLYAWIRRGLVAATRADHGQHRGVYWVELDEDIASRLQSTRLGRSQQTNAVTPAETNAPPEGPRC